MHVQCTSLIGIYWMLRSNILGFLKEKIENAALLSCCSDPVPESYQLSIYHFNQANVSHSNVVYYTFLKVKRDLSDFSEKSKI